MDRSENLRTTIPALTGLRGVAACWVMAFHLLTCAGRLGLSDPQRMPIVLFGWTAVDLFFVLSGFVLALAHRDERWEERGVVVRFALARVLRIYPTHLVVLTGIAALVLADPGFAGWYRDTGTGNLSAVAFVRTAMLATRWGVGAGEWNEPVWSLSVELLGYAMLPALLIVTRGFRRAREAAIAATLPVCLLFLYRLSHGGALLNDITTGGAMVRLATGFAAGVALARIYGIVGKAPLFGAALALLGVVALAMIAFFPESASVAPFAFSAIILGVALGDRGPVHRVLSSRPALFLGRVSFPLYLVHAMPLLMLTDLLNRGHATPAIIVAALVIYPIAAVAVAALLHHTVERQTQRLGRRLFRDADTMRERAA